MSTCDLSVVGRNQLLYLEKLKKHNITIYSIKKINEKKIILELDIDDCNKAIELSGKMWYTKVINYRGLSRFFRLFRNNLVIIISAVLFSISLIFLNNIIFDIDYSAVPKETRKVARQIIESQSIERLTPFSRVNENELKRLATKSGLTYFEVERVGFKLKVEAKSQEDEFSRVEAKEKIVAPYNCKIVSIVVFSGVANKQAGDTVLINEVIVDGKATINQNEYTVSAIAQIVVERTVEEEFLVSDCSDKTIDECVAKARLSVFAKECGYKTTIMPVGEQFMIKVELNVLSLIDGG